MTTLKTRDVLNGLGKKGFRLSEGNHKYLIFYFNGKKSPIRTKISHGGKEIDDSLINLMSMQLKLEKTKFVDFIKCPLTQDDYLKELEAQGIYL